MTDRQIYDNWCIDNHSVGVAYTLRTNKSYYEVWLAGRTSEGNDIIYQWQNSKGYWIDYPKCQYDEDLVDPSIDKNTIRILIL